jgi:hypothetical protein
VPSLPVAEIAEHVWAQARFDDRLIESPATNERPVNGPAKFAHPAMPSRPSRRTRDRFADR